MNQEFDSYDDRVTPDLGVVVVTYNSAHVIAELLDSLPAALGGLLADIVVVDNGSTDATVALLHGRGGCRVVRSSNEGYAAGINRGVAELTGVDAVLILNPDVRLAPGSVPALMSALRLPETGIAAPRVVEPDGSLFRSLRREPTLLRALGLGRSGHPRFSEYVTRAADYDIPHVVDWALGAVLLISRQCFDRLGGWDASFFLYSEETDFSLRAADLGLVTRYEPAAEAMHIGGQSGQSSKTHTMQIINRVRLYRRRHGRAASAAYFALTVASELSWYVRGNSRSLDAVKALLRPGRRPPELGVSTHLLPR